MKKVGDIFIQFARPGTSIDAEIVSISLRRATRADAFLAVLPSEKADRNNSGSRPTSTKRSTAIDLKKLRDLAFEGIPDNDVSSGLRAKVWKVLLDYLPPSKVSVVLRCYQTMH